MDRQPAVRTGAEQATERKRGSRGQGRALRRRIQRAARERQAAWGETGQPNLTEMLTGELDELYVEHRQNHPEPEAPFRRPTPEMRTDSAKPRGIKKREPRVTTPDERPVRITKGKS